MSTSLSTDLPRGPNPRPHIAFYLPALPAGGLEQVTLTLVAALTERGCQVDLILERAFGAYLERIPDTVRLVELKKSSKRAAYSRLIWRWPREGIALGAHLLFRRHESVPLRRLRCLVDHLDQSRPEVLIAAAGDIPFLALWAQRLARNPPAVIVAEHNTMSRRIAAASNDRSESRTLAKRLRRAQRLYPQADGLIAVSTGVAEDMVNTIGTARESINVIYNPIVSPQIERRSRQTPQCEWLNAGSGPLILAAGRLVPQKNFGDLIDAFALIHGARPNTRLVIIGEGPERASLEARAAMHGLSDKIHMPGWADNPYAWMRCSSVFVLCSLFEGFGVALVEAMACGCPVVATNCQSGPAEILDHGRYGPLVAEQDIPALANGIERMLDAPPSKNQLKDRAACFSVDRAVDRYIELIEHHRSLPVRS